MEPGYADGWVNVGRARIQEGNVDGAEQVLRKALEIDPKLAKTHFFLGTRVEDRRPTTTRRCEHLRAAASQYPRDRVVLTRSGACCSCSGSSTRRSQALREGARHRPGRSAGALQPDALLPGAGRTRSGRARAGALRAVQGGRIVAGDHRAVPAAAPDDNNERQPIHEHRPAQAAGRRRPRPPSGEPAVSAPDTDPSRPLRRGWHAAAAAAFCAARVPRRLRSRSATSRGRPGCGSRTTAARSARNTCPRRSGRASSFSTRTATAGRTCSSSTRRTGRAAPREVGRRAVSQQPRRHVHRRDARGRPRRPDLWHRRRRRRLRQRRRRRSLRDGARRQSPVPEPRRRQVRGRHRERRRRRAAGSRPARCGSTTTTTASSICSSRTTSTGRREGSLLHARRQEQVVLHAGILQGPERHAVSQPRRRHVRGRDEARPACSIPTSKALGVAHARLRRRRPDGPVRRQRHAAEPPVSQQGQRHVRRTSAVAAGVAFSEAGVARAGMGVDAADYDGSGRPSLIIGNFSNEMMALYHNEGNGLFIDEAPASDIGRASLLTLTFGCFFFDYDLDGRPDIFAANGHVADDIERVQRRVTYAAAAAAVPQPREQAVRGRQRRRSARRFDGRSSAAARPTPTIDGDGDLDSSSPPTTARRSCFATTAAIATTCCASPTIGTASNRDGIGARVEVTTAGGARLWQIVKTGSSYASQSELRSPSASGPRPASRQSRYGGPAEESIASDASRRTRRSRSRRARGIVRSGRIGSAPR